MDKILLTTILVRWISNNTLFADTLFAARGREGRPVPNIVGEGESTPPDITVSR
jgi:hypothetical protein